MLCGIKLKNSGYLRNSPGTGVLASRRDFWWDDVDRLFLQTVSLPRKLSLTVGGEAHHWDLADGAEYPEDSQRLNRHWRAWGEPDPTVRHFLFRTIYYLLYPLPENERQCLVDELLEWGGLTQQPMGHRTLTQEEIIALGSSRLMEIGAHTVNHSLLGAAPTARQRHEIQQSKADLEHILQRPVPSFAYPFGKRGDYSEETVELVRASGFCSACSNFPGIVTQDTDKYQLPRMFMANWTADELAAQLNTWFEN
jgi:peptidoglycan/xylan/chitin deacetylase (PgdA/CDA1 family)